MPAAVYERRPTWEMIDLFPDQGDWSVEEYLALHSAKQIEFTDGYLEFLPMPDEVHQWIVIFVQQLLTTLTLRRGGGLVMIPPFKIKIDEKRFREPDVCLMPDANDPRRGRRFWAGADLVVEVVSRDNPERDYWKKRGEYAAAKIPEYWVIDPHAAKITVLKLDGPDYVEHGQFGAGTVAHSPTIEGLSIDVTECLSAGGRATTNDNPTPR